MEGTRNEKVLIVASAYIIGFTTAFIAFGVNTTPETQVPVYNSNQAYVQALSTTQDIGTISSIEKNDKGLFAVTGGYSRLLSAKRGSQEANLIAATPTAGFHTAVIAETLSKDAKFIYFCEQQIADAKDCTPYVYSLADDSLHPVKVNGKAYIPKVEAHYAAWIDDNILQLNGMLSNTAERPWEFTVTLEATPETVEAEAPAKNTTQITPSEMPAETRAESPQPQTDQPQLQ